LTQLLRLVHIDGRPAVPQPSLARIAGATLVALVGFLVADMALVALGQHVFPTVRHYGHFRLSDYGKLTVIGVLIACAGWPLVTRITTTPRWVFLRLAVLVSLVLLAPDAYIYEVQRQPLRGVFVLVWLHVAIAIITYNALVRLAPAGSRSSRGVHRHF
jgi:hypothetical protein